MPGSRAAQNLQMPLSYPAGGALGAAEIDWCIITDALVVLFAIKLPIKFYAKKNVDLCFDVRFLPLQNYRNTSQRSLSKLN